MGADAVPPSPRSNSAEFVDALLYEPRLFTNTRGFFFEIYYLI